MAQRLSITLGIISMLFSFGCSSAQRINEEGTPRKSAAEEAESRSITQKAASEVQAHNFVEIEFKPGSADLTDNAKTSLNKLVQDSGKAGKIDEVMVLSWSDYEYPSKNIKKLPRAQIDLAQKRNRAVENYVKSIQRVDVDAYNMAEQPNALSKWFNATDSRLKNALVAAGLPTTADDPQYPSKASHSVVLVKIE